MDYSYWQKQDAKKPLFPDLLWSRPENRRFAGKLLIIGGNIHNFSAPAEAYAHAEKAGIGSVRIVLPDALQKTVGAIVPEAEFAPSTPSGSFARSALETTLSAAAWADGVLIAGDVGRNSETTILLESFLKKYSGQITILGDALDVCIPTPELLQDRPDTTVIATFRQLQQILTNSPEPIAITSSMDLLQLVEALHLHSINCAYNIVCTHHNTTIVASEGKVITTQSDSSPSINQLAASCATWWLQNPSKTNQALTTGVYGT